MSRQHYRLATLVLVGAGACLLSPSQAEAEFILREVRAREVLDPIGFYEAEVVLTGPPGTFINGSNEPLERDFFTVFNIPDLEGDVGKPPGWSSRADLIPDGMPDGFDDPGIPNITFSYLAGEPIFLPAGQSELVIGTFSWQTFDVDPLILLSQIRFGWQTSLLVNGEVEKRTGFGVAPVNFIPEPSSFALALAGLAGAASAASIRRRGRRAG